MQNLMTPLPTPETKSTYVNQMFAEIAPTYDLMNRLMTGMQDQRWRKEMLGFCALPPRGRLLDVGTGTGDIAYEALAMRPGMTAMGSDFTYEMMAHGVGKVPGRTVHFAQADALALPYADNAFDAVTSGFLLRNVTDLNQALSEQRRVTAPGGKVVCLEITPPSTTLLGPFIQFYFFNIVPLIGGLISGARDAYTYLPHSTVAFAAPDELQRRMEFVGLKNVFYVTKMFGTVAIHVGEK